MVIQDIAEQIPYEERLVLLHHAAALLGEPSPSVVPTVPRSIQLNSPLAYILHQQKDPPIIISNLPVYRSISSRPLSTNVRYRNYVLFHLTAHPTTTTATTTIILLRRHITAAIARCLHRYYYIYRAFSAGLSAHSTRVATTQLRA